MMNSRWAFITFVFCFNLVYGKLELKISKGKIRGQILSSRNGRPFYSYTRIPYAKPPIGELRFEAPEPVEPWSGILDATVESNICIQSGVTDSQEDCLYLNVFSPKTSKKSLPVMFWIHGGGFTSGHSKSDFCGPEYFMDKDVVIITINYRLGILDNKGFFSTEDNVIPGNYGMKDQVFALRWVRENIAEFNGDPDQVTIFGGSAGAASVGFHMLSPMSKGLFHKAILQSGAPVCKWAIPPPGLSRKRAHSAATVASCNFESSEELLKCLRNLPAEYFMNLHTKLFTWLNFPSVLFSPVVENCNSGEKAFLCRHPIYNFKQESFVPAIIGLNSAEGGLFASSLYNSTSLVQTDLRTQFNRITSIILFYYYYTKPENIEKIGENVMKKYFSSGGVDDNSHLNSVKMMGDGAFIECALDMAYKLKSPVYGYLYDYQNEFSFNKLFGSCEKPLGVTHGDELNSLFKISGLNPNDLNARDLEVSKVMVNIWTKFASSDYPTIDGNENGLVWPKFTQSKQFMMYVNSSRPSIILNPFNEEFDFWNKLPFFLNKNH